MTLETKTLISVVDITAIHYRCTNCGTVMAVPVAKEHSVPGKCGLCDKHWFPSVGDPRQNDIYRMVASIRAAQGRVSEFKETEIPLEVSLEIATVTQ